MIANLLRAAFRRYGTGTIGADRAAVQAQLKALTNCQMESAQRLAEMRAALDVVARAMEKGADERASTAATESVSAALVRPETQPDSRRATEAEPSIDLSTVGNRVEDVAVDLQRLMTEVAPLVLDTLHAVGNDLKSGLADQRHLTGVSTPSILNSLNAMENNLLVLVMRAEQAAARNARRDALDLLQRRAASVRSRRHKGPSVAQPGPHVLPELLKDLERRAPRNFAAWKRRFDDAEIAYRNSSAADLSVDWHREAFLFRDFLAVHAIGRILDVGVGPLSTPSYLRDFPVESLAGLDPLAPFEPHPFPFAQTVSELIPWPDASFETVVAATSLDHIYLLDVAMSEVDRVLTPDGLFVVWTGLFANTPVYNPYGEIKEPADAYHLFHPGENWFTAFLGRWFRLRERIEVGPNNVFLALERAKGPIPIGNGGDRPGVHRDKA